MGVEDSPQFPRVPVVWGESIFERGREKKEGPQVFFFIENY